MYGGNKNQFKIMLMVCCIIQKDPFWVKSILLCYHLEAIVGCQWVGFVSFLPSFSPLSQAHPPWVAVQFSPLLHLCFPWPVMSCAGKEWGSERKSEGSRNIYPREEPALSRKDLWAVGAVSDTTGGHLSSSVIVWVARGALVWVQPDDYRLQNVAFKKIIVYKC